LIVSFIVIDACQKLSFLLTEGEKQDTYLAPNLLEGVIINLQQEKERKKERKEKKRKQEKNHHSGYIEYNNQ
jgi:hypothetical protein